MDGILAQLGEHLPYKQRVTGSSPVGPTSLKREQTEYGEIAQLARAHGSYPWCRGFKSPSRYYEKMGNAEEDSISFFVSWDGIITHMIRVRAALRMVHFNVIF